MSFKKTKLGLLGNVGTAISELESGRQVEPFGEYHVMIGAPVTIPVFEDDQFVVGLFIWQPLRIRRHRGNPQPPAAVKGHGNGIADREFLLASEQLDGVALGGVEVFERLLGVDGCQIECAPPVGLDRLDFLR